MGLLLSGSPLCGTLRGLLCGTLGGLLRSRTLLSGGLLRWGLLLCSWTLRGLLRSRTLLSGGLLRRGLLLCSRTLRGLLRWSLFGYSLLLRGWCHFPSLGLIVESIWDLERTTVVFSKSVPH